MYYYYGETKSYYGKVCFVVNLGEYKKRPEPDSYIYVNFPPEKGKWAVLVKSLSVASKR